MPQKEDGFSIWRFILGLALIVLGIFALSSVFIVSLSTLFIFGILLFVGGIFQVILSFIYKEEAPLRFSLVLFIGVLYAVLGYFALANSGLSLLTITLLLALLLITIGIFRIIVSISLRQGNWGWTTFSGIISLILGIMVYNSWPLSSFWVIGLFIGIELILSGISWIFTSHNRSLAY